MNITSQPPEIIREQCKLLDDDELGKFTTSSKRIYDACKDILNDRKKIYEMKKFVGKFPAFFYKDIYDPDQEWSSIRIVQYNDELQIYQVTRSCHNQYKPFMAEALETNRYPCQYDYIWKLDNLTLEQKYKLIKSILDQGFERIPAH